MSKGRLLAVGALFVLCVLALRIGWVNAHALTEPSEHYKMGEWVDLSGSYLYELQSEDMRGYSVRINRAESLSYHEFTARYAKEPPPATAVPKNADEKTIVVLEYEVKNEGNDGGGIGLYQHNLVPARRNVAYTMNADLWALVEPQMKGKIGGLGLKRDSRYTTHVPFTFVADPPYFQKLDHEINQAVADDSSFELTLSNAPVRKIVDISIS